MAPHRAHGNTRNGNNERDYLQREDRNDSAIFKRQSHPDRRRTEIRHNFLQTALSPGCLPYGGSPPGWYEIKLLHGKKYPKQDLFNAIAQLIQPPLSFVPYNIKVYGDDLTFFVDDGELAEAIQYKANGGRIEMLDGCGVRCEIQIRVRPMLPEVEIIDDTTRNIIRRVISSLVDQTTLHLNLSRFHKNKEFKRCEVFVPLNRRTVLQTVFEIIAESIPGEYLCSLDLSNNMLYNASHLVVLKHCMPRLTSLTLSFNRIRSLAAFSCLQGMKLEKLFLQGNPICSQAAYVSQLRRTFQCLRLLDNVRYPLADNADSGVEEDLKELQLSHDSSSCNTDRTTITNQFLQQFFHLYDNQNNRDGLLEAYADHAQLYMRTTDDIAFHLTRGRYYGSTNYRRRGKGRVVQFLNTLPKTQHDLTTLSIGLLEYGEPKMISLRVGGVYRETDNLESITWNFKAFDRTFLLRATGSCVSIDSDTFRVRNATPMQIMGRIFPTLIASPSSVPTTSPQAVRAAVPTTSDISDLSQRLGMLTTSSAVETGTSNVVDDESSRKQEEMITLTKLTGIVVPTITGQAVNNDLRRKQEMATELATEFGMNMLWAEKFLVELNWDIISAKILLLTIERPRIPNEAFDMCAKDSSSS